VPAIHQKTNVVAFYGRHRLRRYSLLLLAIIVVLAVYRVTILSVQRSFDTDEFEHIQDAWLISQGFSIYRDFFEHHPPLLYLFLAPLFAFFDESEALFIARMSMVPFAVGILAMTYLIAAKIRGRLAGVIACALLSTLVVFQQKSIEIRPDVPAVFFSSCVLLQLHF
jgi:4-amino-4-deoxy-L-arabinose transferase-like glycosyltransferase